MHTLHNSKDFCKSTSQSCSPLPNKNSSKNSEVSKSDDKNSEKPRPPSANSSSAVKPPYSYIALSNYQSAE